MKKLIYLLIFMTIATDDLSGQTLTIEDMVKNIRQYKEYKTIKGFIEKHGFDYDTVLLPGKTGKLYSFMSEKEFTVKGLDEDTLQLKNAVFIRMEDEVTLRKLTLMTASKEYYQQLVVEMVKKKFKITGSQDRNKPMTYESELYPSVPVTISVIEAVKDDKRYARYQVAVVY